MPKRIEGFLDDGHGTPLPGIPAVARRLSTGVVADTTLTDATGRWLFDLPIADEYVVTLTDADGNAVSRAPWSGELRAAWVRDRLDVAGLPVMLDPTGGNALAWTASGLYVPPIPAAIDAYTKTQSDARYAELTDVDPFPQYLTPIEGNATYLPLAGGTLTGDLTMAANVLPTTSNARDLGTLMLQWRKLWAVTAEFVTAPTVGGSSLLTATTADALFLTPAEGNAAYATTAHAHDAAYVNATGDVMSGGLTVGTATAPQLGLSTPTNAAGALAGLTLSTGSGWSTRFGTLQGQWWFAFMDGAGTVAWGDDATNLRLVSRSISMDATRRLIFADENKDDKIQFFSGGYTLGIRAATLAYRVPTSAVHRFYVNDVDTLDVAGNIVTVNAGNLYLGSGTAAHTLQIHGGGGGAGVLTFRNAGAPLDAKYWEWIHDASGQLYCRTVNDAYSAADNVLIFSRTGYDFTQLGVYGKLYQTGGHAILADASGGSYPPSGAAFAVGWNFTGGSRDITMWNTDVNNTVASRNPSFVWRQLLGASSRTDLMELRADGTLSVFSATTSIPIIAARNGAGVVIFGANWNGAIFTSNAAEASVNAFGTTPVAGFRKIQVLNSAGAHIGYIPVYN